MRTLDEQMLKEMKLRQQRIDARKRAIDAQRERKLDTRRKILIGSVVRANIAEGVMDEKLLRGWLDQVLTRPDDRDLFNLPPRQ